MLATEYLCIVHHRWQPIINMRANVHSHLEIIALLHTNTSFSILRQPCFLSLTLHNPSIIVIVYFVKLL